MVADIAEVPMFVILLTVEILDLISNIGVNQATSIIHVGYRPQPQSCGGTIIYKYTTEYLQILAQLKRNLEIAKKTLLIV